MQYHDTALDRSSEERDEAERHDELYLATRPASLVLIPEDWQVFDSIPEALNSYHLSVVRLGDVSGQRVLDAGCGDGWLSVILAKRGARVDGFDLSREAVRIARDRAAANGVTGDANFDVASFYALPYEDDTFDVITGQAILHHLRDKQRVAQEIRRVLKPGGLAVFNEPFGNSDTLERLRLLVPVPSDTDQQEHWRDQVKYQQLAPFQELFEVEWQEVHLLSRLDRVISWRPLVRAMGRLDRFLLEHVRWLRRYARSLVLQLRNTKRTADLT